jgi:hypothetical protein
VSKCKETEEHANSCLKCQGPDAAISSHQDFSLFTPSFSSTPHRMSSFVDVFGSTCCLRPRRALVPPAILFIVAHLRQRVDSAVVMVGRPHTSSPVWVASNDVGHMTSPKISRLPHDSDPSRSGRGSRLSVPAARHISLPET